MFVDLHSAADTGDFVIVLNCDKVILTGKKLDQKLYVRRSPRPGHLKEMKYRKLLAERRISAFGGAHNSLWEYSGNPSEL